jgi:hypothetical protein
MRPGLQQAGAPRLEPLDLDAARPVRHDELAGLAVLAASASTSEPPNTTPTARAASSTVPVGASGGPSVSVTAPPQPDGAGQERRCATRLARR